MNEKHEKIEVFGSTIFTKQITQKAPRTNAPTLVFLHEGLGSVELWRDFPQQLCEATGLEGFLYDRRGYGKSSPLLGEQGVDYLNVEAWNVLPNILSTVGIKNVILVGHSDGGSIALLYASKFPSQVVGVISEAAHVFIEETTLRGVRNAQLSYELTGLRSRLARYHGEKTPEMFNSWSRTWLSEDFRNWNIEQHLSNVVCPVLAIQGVEDHFGTERQLRSIVDRTGGRAEELLIHGCAHTPHSQATEDVLSAMQKFIEGVMAELGMKRQGVSK